MSLSNWARFYIFTPLSRFLLRRRKPGATPLLTPTTIVLFSHLATMIAIGLWHDINWNFFIWGAWHGVGLFVHKQWSDRTRKWYRRPSAHYKDAAVAWQRAGQPEKASRRSALWN